MDADGQQLQRAVLFGRAGWSWARTDPPRRQAFFATGIGGEAAQFIHDHLRVLLQPLRDAELASMPVTRRRRPAQPALAEVLVRVHPFAGKALPRRWRELVGVWLGAIPLGSVLSSEASEEVQFVPPGVGGGSAPTPRCRRRGDWPQELSRAIALALIHGVSSVSAALLVEAGWGSRGMAVEVTRLAAGASSIRRDWTSG